MQSTSRVAVVSGPGPPGEQARLHNADLGLAQLGEGAAYRIVDDAVVAVLSEMVSKSPCSFPMISTTACDLANSRASRWFSARSRPGSSVPPAALVARCGRRGADAPRATASRAAAHLRIWDWYRPSRRSTAALWPCAAASYSATTRARYSAVNDRRTGRAAGSTKPSAGSSAP